MIVIINILTYSNKLQNNAPVCSDAVSYGSELTASSGKNTTQEQINDTYVYYVPPTPQKRRMQS